MDFFLFIVLKVSEIFIKSLEVSFNGTDIGSIFICSFWTWPDFHKCKALTDAVFCIGL